MKKIILVTAIALVTTITSCRKERTCECKINSTEVRVGFGEQTVVENSTTKISKDKQRKNQFKYSSDCFSETYSYNDEGGSGSSSWSSVTTVVSICELK